MRILLTLSLTVALLTAARGADPAKKPARITYDEHVLPILKDKCVSCHNVDKKRGGLVLNNYTKVMEGGSSGASVKPGDPDNSLLYKTMAHTAEPFMPPKSPRMAKEPLDILHQWIAGGAPENSGSKVVVPDRPKVDFTLAGAAKGKPAGPPPMPPPSLRLDPLVRAARDTAVTALAASPWAPLVAVGGQKQVLLYHSDTLDLLGVLPFPEGTPTVLKFSRNGALLLAGGGRGGKSGRVVIWSVVKGDRLFEVGDESDAVLAADISPDQTRVALGGPGKVVRLYTTKDGKLSQEIRKHTDWVTALEFSPDGVLLATGDRSGGLLVWEAFTARDYFTLKGPAAAVTEICWRPDSNVVAASGEDGQARLYEMENGNQIRAWGAHGGGALSLRYGMDGRLVSAGRDRLVRLYNGDGGVVRTFEALPDVTLRAVLSHDSARVIAADWTGQIAVWSAADGKRLGVLTANPPPVAEQIAALEKALLERQKSHDALLAAQKASEAAQVAATANLTAAQKAVGDTATAAKTAEVKFQQAQAAVSTAQAAIRNAQFTLRAKDALARALAEAAAKVKAEADKAKENGELQAAAQRALTLASQAAAELALAQKSEAGLAAALKAVEPTVAPAQQTLAAAQAVAQAAPKNLPPAQNAVKMAQAKAAADKAAVDQSAAELAPARARIDRLRAAAALAQKNPR